MPRSLTIAVLAVAITAAGVAAEPERASAASVTAGSLTFNADAYALRSEPIDPLNYRNSTPVPLKDTGVHDRFGVRMYLQDGRLYDHPVAQAQYGLALLNAYRVTKNAAYLDRAKLQAQRLLDRSVLAGSARFYPYRFTFALHRQAALTMSAPWYSGMAQGLALALFARLNVVTKASKWRTASDQTFASYLRPRSAGLPWTTTLLKGGWLWFEEYASPNLPPDLTFNGHMFATLGLVDYYRLTKSATALKVYRGGVTSINHFLPTIRNDGWISSYCIAHRVLSTGYHRLHVSLLLSIYALTAATGFARAADALNADYPYPPIPNDVRFLAGRHTGYVFDESGRISRTKSASVASTSRAPASGRFRVKGQSGYWYQITDGLWAGYAVRESSTVYARGTANVLLYGLSRRVTFLAGVHTGIKVSATGAITARKSYTLTATSNAPALRFGVVNGRASLLISGGIWAGYWLPISSSVFIAARS